MTQITYMPPADEPSQMKWGGRTFKANVPVDMTDKDGYYIMESVRTERPDGVIVLTSRERFVTFEEMAKGNPMFKVEGHEKESVVPLDPSEMSTPTQYRAYALEWFRDAIDPVEFRQRWRDEADLREQCGMTHDDVRFLEPHMNTRLNELKEVSKGERVARRRA